MNKDLIYTRRLLQNLRQEARSLKVKIPKHLTAMRVLRCVGSWWTVEADGFCDLVQAHSAYGAKCVVIEKLLADHKQKQQAKAEDPGIAAAIEFGFRCHEKGMNLEAARVAYQELFLRTPAKDTCPVCHSAVLFPRTGMWQCTNPQCRHSKRVS